MEVLEELENAVKTSKTKKEIEDKWRVILEKTRASAENLTKKESKYDHIISKKGGFELEVESLFRKKELYEKCLKRAIKMKKYHDFGKRRCDFNKQASSGRLGPALSFVNNKELKAEIAKEKESEEKEGKGGKETEKKPSDASSFWGERLPALKRKSDMKKSEVDQWLNDW